MLVANLGTPRGAIFTGTQKYSCPFLMSESNFPHPDISLDDPGSDHSWNGISFAKSRICKHENVDLGKAKTVQRSQFSVCLCD